MNSRTRLYILIPSLLIAGFLAWYFSNILIYIILAAIVSFIGRPLMKILQGLTIRNFTLPPSVCAILTLGGLYLSISLLFIILIPGIGRQAKTLSSIDSNQIITSLEEPISKLQNWAEKYQIYDRREEIVKYLEEKFADLVGNMRVAALIESVGGFIGNVFVAMFAITFISFFFLKESRLLQNIILTLAPKGYEERVEKILTTIKPLLTRYFLGVLIEVLLVGGLIALGLSLLGVKNALFIGFFAGTLNVIPYLGPIIGAILGLILTMIASLELSFYDEMIPLLLKVALVFGFVQLLDNMVFQPFIYSSSVKAHPLEIFLVILMAGSFAGVAGMILAIPIYTIFRVIAKEFLSEFKIVQSLTRDI